MINQKDNFIESRQTQKQQYFLIKFLKTSTTLIGRQIRIKQFWIFFFNDTATTEISPLSLHDALPISIAFNKTSTPISPISSAPCSPARSNHATRSEEHTSELQSRSDLVCRLLLD